MIAPDVEGVVSKYGRLFQGVSDIRADLKKILPPDADTNTFAAASEAVNRYLAALDAKKDYARALMRRWAEAENSMDDCCDHCGERKPCTCAAKMKLLVCHSDQERCGVREYGRQLDEAMPSSVVVKAFTFKTMDLLIDEARRDRAARVLIHFEPALLTPTFHRDIERLRAQGTKVAMCCHLYSQAAVAPYENLVDAFVVHRQYDYEGKGKVEIPLGCPVYVPPDRSELRRRFGMHGKIAIITVGFLVRWKCIPEVLDALLHRTSELGIHDELLWICQTPWPFVGAAEEEKRVRAVLAKHPRVNVQFSTAFLPEKDLLDRVYASDLGFVFHNQHTSSVSAATKQFVSARCPLVVTSSSHSFDIQEGVVRVDTFDPSTFAKEVVSIARFDRMRERLRAGMEEEYQRLNMKAVAKQYVALLEKL